MRILVMLLLMVAVGMSGCGETATRTSELVATQSWSNEDMTLLLAAPRMVLCCEQACDNTIIQKMEHDCGKNLLSVNIKTIVDMCRNGFDWTGGSSSCNNSHKVE